MKFLHYFQFLWVTFALLDPDPDPDSNANPDPADLNQCESGSTTQLISTVHTPSSKNTGSGSGRHLSARGKEMRTDRWGGGRQTDRRTRYRVAGRQTDKTVQCRQAAGRHTGSRRSETGIMDIWTSNGLSDSRWLSRYCKPK